MPIKYQKIDSSWGLVGFYENYRLVFNGLFGRQALAKQILQRLFPTLPKNQNQNKKIQDIDLYKLFSKSAKHAWSQAYAFAKNRKSLVGAEDIFLSLLQEPSVKNLLNRLKVNTKEAENFLKNYLTLAHASSVETVKKIPFEAFDLAVKINNHKIGSLMLLGALLKTTPKDNILQAIFSNIGLTQEKLELFAVWLLKLNHDFPNNSPESQILYCLRQAQGLEDHFGYFFELPAIEAAVKLSQGKTLKDLGHKKALQLLVKAGQLAQQQHKWSINENFITQAAAI